MEHVHEAGKVAVTPMTNRESEDEPRLVLHASMTNGYLVMIFMGVNCLVAMALQLYEIWTTGTDPKSAVFFIAAMLLMTGMVAYAQTKLRWLVARPSGLTITVRKGSRVVPWRDVRVVDDLGWLGGGPGAKRYYLEFSDGTHFTFLGDPEQMKRLRQLREGWTKRSHDERVRSTG